MSDIEKQQEEMLRKKYGSLPNKKDLLNRQLKGNDKKYFDSADYAQDKDSAQPSEVKSVEPAPVAPPVQDSSLVPPPKPSSM